MKDQKKTERLSQEELKETTGGNMGTGMSGSGSGMGGSSINPPSDWQFGNVFEETQGDMNSGDSGDSEGGGSGMDNMGGTNGIR